MALFASAALIAVSRVLTLESVNGYTMDDLRWSVPRVLLGVILPILVACGLLLGTRRSWTVGLAHGLIAGTALVLTFEVVLWGVILTATDGYSPGSAYWSVVGAWSLVVGVAVSAAARGLAAGTRPGHGPRRAVCAILVAACLVVQVTTSGVPPTEPWWLSANVAAFLVATAGLPLCVLAVPEAARVAGLAAVTLFECWLIVLPLSSLLAGDWQGDVGTLVITHACRLTSVAACFVAQARAAAPTAPRPADADHDR